MLQRRLADLSARAGFVNGMYLRNLATGCGGAVNAGAQFPAVSTLKAAILRDVVRRPRGESQTLLDRMIIGSDDHAANEALRLQGGGNPLAGTASVTETMYRLGMTKSLVRRPHIIENAAIPYELATLMTRLHQGALGNGPVRRSITRRLLEVRDRSKIVAGVSADMPAAHTTGYTTEMRADAGVVYAPRGPIVVSVMGWSNSGASDAFIARVTAAAGRLSGGRACCR